MVDEPGADEPQDAAAWWDRAPASLTSRGGVAAAVVVACPYLVTSDGWRALTVSREHRCAAIDPPGSIGADRQRRLCLTSQHGGCGTYRASEELRAVPQPVERHEDGLQPRPIVQTMPVLLERARAGANPSFGLGRRGAQLGLVLLMSVALGALIYARGIVPASERMPEPTPSPAPTSLATAAGVEGSPSVSLLPSPSPDRPSPSPVATPAPSVSPSRAAAPSPTATPARTYTVQLGDTLVSIAARFGTTATELRTLNHISDPRLLRAGQVLILP